MTVSDKRYRDYKRARRTGLNARSAFYVTSKPRYDVDAYCERQDVMVDGETFCVRCVPDDDSWSRFREDVESGFYTEDDAPFVNYLVIVVEHVASGVSESLCGVVEDNRDPYGDRWVIDAVCDVIDDVRAELPRAARALLPYQGAAR